jgi:hypothetical protein
MPAHRGVREDPEDLDWQDIKNQIERDGEGGVSRKAVDGARALR